MRVFRALIIAMVVIVLGLIVSHVGFYQRYPNIHGHLANHGRPLADVNVTYSTVSDRVGCENPISTSVTRTDGSFELSGERQFDIRFPSGPIDCLGRVRLCFNFPDGRQLQHDIDYLDSGCGIFPDLKVRCDLTKAGCEAELFT